ncbi:flagellar filament outer layer protein [Spirochaetia bacterium]|nr:flagellar filament outer layer protein [Spirochaetia bacterium]
MKRTFILVVIVSLLAGSLFADEAILIDFTKLAADISVNDQGGALNQNQRTLMDFSNAAGSNYRAQADQGLFKSSLAITNWDVTLSSSSRTVENQTASYVRPAASKEHGTVMGVRVHFPVEAHNAWATIKPPFEIPAFESSEVDADGNVVQGEAEGGSGSPTRFEASAADDGTPQSAYGVVKNVGTIKSVAVSVYGLNFPHHLSAILIDSDGNEKIVSIGYLNFDGWGELVWNNPAYVQEVRNRELRLYPLYPTSTPFVKFGGFLVQRDASALGGDFIAYFKDVKIIYDKATLDTEKDIDDENEWGIIKAREGDKDRFQLQNFGKNQILRYQEQQKKAMDLPFGDPARNNNSAE